MIFIFGLPRSGTTWTAKIFDSHPRVIYTHEPDIARPPRGLPVICPWGEIDTHLPAARAHLALWTALRDVKSRGSRPVFPKIGDNWLRYNARKTVVYGAKSVEHVLPWTVRFLRVPGFYQSKARHTMIPVLKSVSALGRVGLYSRACENSRTVVIIRHPCGHVASVLRSMRRKKNPDPIDRSALLQSRFAKQRGLTRERMAAMSDVAVLAWKWVIFHEEAFANAAHLDTIRTVTYEDLASDPMAQARALFEFCGLSWNAQTEAFLERSVHHAGKETHYQIYRDAEKAMTKWKSELSSDIIATIMDVARGTAPGRLFPDI